MHNNLHILTSHNIPAVVLDCDVTSGILLIREAVYLLLQPLPASIAKLKIYALESDLLARGLINLKLDNNITLINYSEFVDLTIAYQTNTTW